MYPSFIIISKPALAAHGNACKSFLLLSSWAAVIAYALLLLCIYPYPVAVTELITVFLKLVCLSNGVTGSVYVVAVVVRHACLTIRAELHSKAISKTTVEERLMPGLFTALSAQASPAAAEPELYYTEKALQPSFY